MKPGRDRSRPQPKTLKVFPSLLLGGQGVGTDQSAVYLVICLFFSQSFCFVCFLVVSYCLAVLFWFLGSFQVFVRLSSSVLFLCVEFVRQMLFMCSVSCSSFLILSYVFFASSEPIQSQNFPFCLFPMCCVFFFPQQLWFLSALIVFVRLCGLVFWYVYSFFFWLWLCVLLRAPHFPPCAPLSPPKAEPPPTCAHPTIQPIQV